MNIADFTTLAAAVVLVGWPIWLSVHEFRRLRGDRLVPADSPADDLRYSDFRARTSLNPIKDYRAQWPGAIRDSSEFRPERSHPEKPCCVALRIARNDWGVESLSIMFNSINVSNVQLEYCPQCGRKIDAKVGKI